VNADASFPVLWDRRAGPGCGDGGIHHRWSMRMGRLSDEGAGEALARRSQMERYSDADVGEFL